MTPTIRKIGCWLGLWTIFAAVGIGSAEGEKAVNVALFTDPQATIGECVRATQKIIADNRFEVKTVTAAQIRGEGLDGFDLVIFPGGGGNAQAQALGQFGCRTVEQFVKNGGAYIGICGGGYLAAKGYTPATTWLELVNAAIVDVDHWGRGTGEVEVRLTDPSHPILDGVQGSITAHYANGPLYNPAGDPSLPTYQELAVFVGDIHSTGGASPGVMPGKTALLASVYGKGRCVLFSFHPELTPGLDGMLVKAVRWATGL